MAQQLFQCRECRSSRLEIGFYFWILDSGYILKMLKVSRQFKTYIALNMARESREIDSCSPDRFSMIFPFSDFQGADLWQNVPVRVPEPGNQGQLLLEAFRRYDREDEGLGDCEMSGVHVELIKSVCKRWTSLDMHIVLIFNVYIYT